MFPALFVPPYERTASLLDAMETNTAYAHVTIGLLVAHRIFLHDAMRATVRRDLPRTRGKLKNIPCRSMIAFRFGLIPQVERRVRFYRAVLNDDRRDVQLRSFR